MTFSIFILLKLAKQRKQYATDLNVANAVYKHRYKTIQRLQLLLCQLQKFFVLCSSWLFYSSKAKQNGLNISYYTPKISQT